MAELYRQEKVKKVIKVFWTIYRLLGFIGLTVLLIALLLSMAIPVEMQMILSKLISLYIIGVLVFGWIIALVNNKNQMKFIEKIVISLWLGGGVVLMLLSIAEVPQFLGFLVWYFVLSCLFGALYFFRKKM